MTPYARDVKLRAIECRMWLARQIGDAEALARLQSEKERLANRSERGYTARQKEKV